MIKELRVDGVSKQWTRCCDIDLVDDDDNDDDNDDDDKANADADADDADDTDDDGADAADDDDKDDDEQILQISWTCIFSTYTCLKVQT